MPRRRGLREPVRLDTNLTALLDVVLQLIAFFMMLVHFETRVEASEQAIRLPVTSAALPTSAMGQDRLVVTIDATGRLDLGGQALNPAQSASWWAEQASLRRAGRADLGEAPANSLAELATRVLVRADKDAPYGAVRATLSVAQEQGFARFSLVVLREEQ